MQGEAQTMLSRRRFDVDEYHQMAQAGILHEDDPVELIEGAIVMMSPVGSPHMSCISRLARLLVLAVDDRALVSPQNPLRLDYYSEPEPDVVLLRPRPDDYATALPGPQDALLVIEVADSSLPYDRGLKRRLYAEAGVPEYWIVNLQDRTVEVHREPSGDTYASTGTVATGSISPQYLPDLELDIADILPPAA